ncbi:threonine--tRNA ligase [Spiroplasma apis]|uniref:Threonine--tRNA ligase n=1 Tax=Spiroplasma apis B31 TaxID=1276258 RepID=V5RKR5_SPIAP|nr:threonine--tRNA ligase [Spiroplasma apis]AHB36405.1 threonyl-tRNA synthetase [Spiroplasma apis B31]
MELDIINFKKIIVEENMSVKDIKKNINIEWKKYILKHNDLILNDEVIIKMGCTLELCEKNDELTEITMNNIAKNYLYSLLISKYNSKIYNYFTNDNFILFDTTENLSGVNNNIIKIAKPIKSLSIRDEVEKDQNENLFDLKELDFTDIQYKEIIFKIINISAFHLNEEQSIQKIEFIYGFDNEEILKKSELLDEKRQRDHRVIGKRLEIFNIDPLIGQGLPIWLPNGTILKSEIKKYLLEKEFEYKFIQIETPVLGTELLYKTSGHWDHYRENMFPSIEMDNKENLVLRPMNCPHHISVYDYKKRSYKELPLRFAEHAIQHRYEFSGSLTGLERVRAMELTDSHIFATKEQLKNEFLNCYKLINEVLEKFNITINYISLSLRDSDDKEKYYDDDDMWNEAENNLEQLLDELKIDYKKMVGEAAFYGPKLDIQARTSQGHEITVSTIQLDFLLPQKFDLTYVGPDGNLIRPIMIHRGLVGTYERFISVLLEQTNGEFSTWYSPVQVDILSLGKDVNDYAQSIQDIFFNNKIRTSLDDSDERIGYKVRNSIIKKTPYYIVVGKNEKENNILTVKKYSNNTEIKYKIDDFISMIKKEIEERI